MTPVEWLVDWMGKNQYFIGNDLLQAIEQAKAMEKEQRGDKNNEGNPGTMTTMSPMDLDNERFFKTEASDYNPSVREKDHPAGETTIEFPTPNQPEQYNPNRPALDTMTFKFEQESNCVDGGEGETLIVEAKSSLGIDGDGGAFYVLKTDQWAISDIDDLIVMLRRVEAAVNATKPTSIHVK